MKKVGLLLILIFSATTADEGWHIEVVDSEGDVGRYTSLVLDSDDKPHVSYRDTNNNELKYAFRSTTEWHFEAVDNVGEHGSAGRSSIALDEDEHPHIAYNKGFGPYYGNLMYAHWDGNLWLIEDVNDETELGSRHPSLALDSNNRPHISFFQYHTKLKYAVKTGDNWSIDYLDYSVYVSAHTSIELDTSDYPHISYGICDGNMIHDLVYIRWDGSEWKREVVESYWDVGKYSSLALDSDGNPRISYSRNYPNEELKYASYDEGEWIIDIVDSSWGVGTENSLFLDSGNNPHITYLDKENDDLKYAYWNDEWVIELIDSTDEVGNNSSIYLDSNDNPHVTYYDRTNENLKYAWYGEDLGAGVNDLSARAGGEGILVNWLYDGPRTASARLLRSAGAESWIGAAGYTLPVDANVYLDHEVMPGVEYRYWLELTEEDGTVHRFGPTAPVTIAPGTGNVTLSEPYPCPATARVTVEYAVPETTRVELVVYDLAGRRIETLVDGERTAGRHAAEWDTSGVAPGVYLCRLITENAALTRRLVVTR
jgi:hypothetical protein